MQCVGVACGAPELWSALALGTLHVSWRERCRGPDPWALAPWPPRPGLELVSGWG